MTRRIWALALVATSAWMAPAAAEDGPKDVSGAWEGNLKAGGAELRLVLHVEKVDGGLKASLDSPDQGAEGMKVDTIGLEGDALKFSMTRPKARFEGRLNADGSEIAGRWTQLGELPLTFRRIDPAKAARPLAVPKELEGLWAGPLKVAAGIELRLVLNVAKGKDGALTAKLDSPDQGAKGIPISTLELKDGELSFSVKSLGASFTGKKNDAGDAFEGTFTQGRAKIPLTLKKTDKIEEARRPQTPKPPFPYDAEEVTYRNEAGDVTLAGSLTIPKGDGPFPVALLITGSGSQDRDETILEHKPFLVLADYLTRRGIAVLRVDDRGVGGSTGSAKTSTSEDFAGDVLAGVAFLKSHAKVDPTKIGLIGHSEGGLIAPMVASRSDDVAFVVLMAGTGLDGAEILTLQGDLIARAMGAKDAARASQAELLKRSYAVLREEKDDKVAIEKLKAIAKETIAALTDEDRVALGEDSSSVDAQMERLASPWFRFFLTFDPRPTLAKVKCPVLAINGEKDLQVPPKENLREIEKAIRSGGNERVTVKELPGLNHLFQTAETGAPSEYAKIEETISPAALEVIGDWIVSQVGSR